MNVRATSIMADVENVALSRSIASGLELIQANCQSLQLIQTEDQV